MRARGGGGVCETAGGAGLAKQPSAVLALCFGRDPHAARWMGAHLISMEASWSLSRCVVVSSAAPAQPGASLAAPAAGCCHRDELCSCSCLQAAPMPQLLWHKGIFPLATGYVHLQGFTAAGKSTGRAWQPEFAAWSAGSCLHCWAQPSHASMLLL